MNPGFRTSRAVALLLLALVGGCSRDTSQLRPAPLDTNPIVYLDEFPPGMDYQAFLGSKVDGLSIDTVEKYMGTSSLKFTIPGSGGNFVGGAFIAPAPRNFSGYNALTFWARSNVPSRLDKVGLANDNSGNSKYEASWGPVLLSTTWTKFVVPIPAPDRLSAERGLFYLAEGPEGLSEHIVWIDEVQFEFVSTITDPRPVMTTKTILASVGTQVKPEGTYTTFSVGGVNQKIDHLPGYFTYTSSNPAVVRATGGELDVVGSGTATITARLGTVDVVGTVTATATAPPSGPAPAPTLLAADVISLFSNTYNNVGVDDWTTDWDAADLTDLKLDGNDTKLYRNLGYAAIQFTSNPIDATEMTHFHMDVFAPLGDDFKIKLVDFGPNGTFSGGDDSEHELTLTASSTPAFRTGAWLSLDIPLTAFTRLTRRQHMAQIFLSGSTSTVYVDNIYFHR